MCESGFCLFPPSACDDRVSDGKTLQTTALWEGAVTPPREWFALWLVTVVTALRVAVGHWGTGEWQRGVCSHDPALFPPLLMLFCSARIISACCHILLISPSSSLLHLCFLMPHELLLSPRKFLSPLLSPAKHLPPPCVFTRGLWLSVPPSEPLTKLLENRQSGAAGALCVFAWGASVAENIYQTWMFSHTNTVTHAFERVCIFAHLRALWVIERWEVESRWHKSNVRTFSSAPLVLLWGGWAVSCPQTSPSPSSSFTSPSSLHLKIPFRAAHYSWTIGCNASGKHSFFNLDNNEDEMEMSTGVVDTCSFRDSLRQTMRWEGTALSKCVFERNPSLVRLQRHAEPLLTRCVDSLVAHYLNHSSTYETWP